MILKRKEKVVVGANHKCEELVVLEGKDMVTVLLPASASETYSWPWFLGFKS